MAEFASEKNKGRNPSYKPQHLADDECEELSMYM